MSTSSQPQTSLDDLIKDLTIDLSDVSSTPTTPITGAVGAGDYSFSYDSNMISTITLSPSVSIIAGGGSSGGFSANTISIDNSSFTWAMPKEWVDCFPDWSRVEDMCKKYPGLEIAFRNFQTVYQLVKVDYDNPTPKK